MTISVSNAHLWVHDQDEALEFWTEKVGFEVRQDITMPELGAVVFSASSVLTTCHFAGMPIIAAAHLRLLCR